MILLITFCLLSVLLTAYLCAAVHVGVRAYLYCSPAGRRMGWLTVRYVALRALTLGRF